MASFATIFSAVVVIAILAESCTALAEPSSGAAAKKEFNSHPTGVTIFAPSNNGFLQVWLTFVFKLPNGETFEKAVHQKKQLTGNSQDYFIPARFYADSACPYAPILKKVCVDQGRHAHSCAKACVTYTGATRARPGSTNWKQCLTDRYRSSSFWRSTCKGESGTRIIAYGGNDDFLVPTKLERASHCAPAL